MGDLGILNINSNYSASFASNATKSASEGLNSAMEKLSTGLRINYAKDDAAGLAISMRLKAELQGISMASRNAADAQNGFAVADTALNTVSSLILRSRELSLLAANDTYSNSDRVALNTELSQLVDEIISIGNNTEFAGIKLFEDKTVTFQIGPNSNDTLDIYAQHFSSVGLSRSGFLQGNILSSSSAQQNIAQLDLAITVVSTYRGQIASTSAKMGYTIANLDQISVNLSSSIGRIEDADFALETGKFAKNQILRQAATAMLSQANASKASVLSLISG